MVSRPARWAAVAFGAAAVVGVVTVVDQGSTLRSVMPALRPRRHVSTGWDSDIAYLRDVVHRNEMGATQAQVAEFDARLEHAHPSSVDELSLVASYALAAFDNAHTCVLHPRFHRLSVRFGWMGDALVIVQARPEFAHLLGHRVTRLGGGAPEQVWPLFAPYVGGGTDAWLRHRAALFFSVPAAIEAIGLGVGPDGVLVETEAPEGEYSRQWLRAESDPVRCDVFRDFWVRIPGRGEPGWVDALAPSQQLPRYLKHPQSRLVLDHLDDGQSLYVLMRGSVDDSERSVEQFHDEVMAKARERDWPRYVIDFRHHTGGDYTKTLPLVKDLCTQARKSNTAIRLIVGPNTFSAGLVAATQFVHWAPERTTVIGGQVGDRLHFRAEGRVIDLPWSGVEVYLCRDAHDLRTTQNPWGDVWLPDKFLLHGVDTFSPDIVAVNTWRDYLEGRDRVLAAALDV